MIRIATWLVVFAAVPAVRLFAQHEMVPVQFCRGPAIHMFDGHSLRGWSKRDGSPHDGWTVDDTALHRRAGGGDLYYQYPVGDFELTFRWRIAPGGNSGLKYRVRPYGNQWLGCEYQILDDPGHRDANKAAGLYDVFDPPAHSPPAIAGVWHQSRIVVAGNHIEHWLNGVRTVCTTVGSPEWQEAVANSKFSGREEFGENREGRLFLQDHGDAVWYRDLVLVPLFPVATAGGPDVQAGPAECRTTRCRPVRRRARRPICIDWRRRGCRANWSR